MTKKIARQLVYDKLAVALSDLKPETKNKKFENRLRETSKVFAAYVIKSTDKDKMKSATGTKKEETTSQESANS
ncbi:MAG: hypothetical protein ACHQFX_09405 [Chitinophagales bacterium]